MGEPSLGRVSSRNMLLGWRYYSGAAILGEDQLVLAVRWNHPSPSSVGGRVLLSSSSSLLCPWLLKLGGGPPFSWF